MADAELVIRDLLDEVAAERGLDGPVEVQALSSGGGNYTSALFAVSINDLKLFAKVAIIGDKMRIIMNAETLFKTEQIVYSELAKTYSDIMKKHESAGLFYFPKVYARLPDLGREAVVMEDLSARGYKTPSRQDSVDWRIASAAVAKLASFHALSFAYEKENPVEFGKMAARLKYIPQQKIQEDESVKTAWEKMLGGAVQVVKDDHKPRLLKLLSDLEGLTKFKSPLSRTVLAHGDFRASNLMFKEQDDTLDIVVLDYQTVHSGCPVSDLLYFIFLGTDQQFRRKHYQDLLALYHRELSVALNGLGMDVEELYPKQTFEKEVKEMQGPALQMAVVILPIVMVDEAAAPQVAGDADLKQLVIAPSELFAERFSALVSDCVDWGVI